MGKTLLLCLAALASCASTFDSEEPGPRAKIYSAYGTIQHLAWDESGKGRLATRDDSGAVGGIGWEVDHTRLFGRAEFLLGRVSTDAQLADGREVDTDGSGYFLIDASMDVSVLPTPDHGRRRTWDVFAGGGIRMWFRDLADGEFQRWFNLSLHAGGAWSHWYGPNRRIFVRARGGASVYTHAAVDDFFLFIPTDEADVTPSPGPVARVDIGVDHGAFHAAAFVDWMAWGESNTRDGFTQPDSSMTRIGVNVGWRW